MGYTYDLRQQSDQVSHVTDSWFTYPASVSQYTRWHPSSFTDTKQILIISVNWLLGQAVYSINNLHYSREGSILK